MPGNTPPWYCKSSIHNQGGFTLIEIVTALVIIGVLAVISTTRFISTSTISVRSAAEMIQADIRYAQEIAMTHHISKSVIFSSGSFTYTFNPASGMDPSGELPSEVTIVNNFTVTFNSLGEPTAGGGSAVSISAGGQSKIIRVFEYTGRVSVD